MVTKGKKAGRAGKTGGAGRAGKTGGAGKAGKGPKKPSGMRLAMVGLGKMGGNMVQRLLRGGHQVVAFDRSSHPWLGRIRGESRGHAEYHLRVCSWDDRRAG